MPSTDIGPGPETDAPAPLVEVMRGAIVESRHRGHVVAVDVSERRIAQLGSPKTVTFLRSSAKPLQLLPVIASGAADRFGFDARELAVACASHNGEPIHTEAVASMLRKIGLDSSALKCGVHEPFSREIARALRKRGQRPNVLQNNCSGKHAAMLALALHLGAPFETYDQPEHPVQQMILSRVEQFTGLPRAEIALGIDGCGAPTFALPVDKMALIYARLVAPPDELDDATKDACRRIVYAMMEYPEMIGGGVTERLDTELMRAARGSLISKIGAEGVYTVGVLPCEEWPAGLGLAIKIEDGEDRRSRPTVVIEALRQLFVLKPEALSELAPYSRFPLRNHRGDTVGEVRASFKLDWTSAGSNATNEQRSARDIKRN